MLGSFRLILALFVVNSHLFSPWYPGAYAVISFYIISGYLMTLIMNKRYGYFRNGVKLFLLNRFLRIYPPYYVAVLFSLLLISFIPREFIDIFDTTLGFPDTVSSIIKNIVILGLEKNEPILLVPIAWSIHVELFYYIMIALFLGRSKKVAHIWLGLSVAYLFTLLIIEKSSFYYRYATIPAASLPFCVGAYLFHYSDKISLLLRKITWQLGIKLSIGLYCIPFLLPPLFRDDYKWLNTTAIPFYLNVFTTAILIWYLMNTPKDKFTVFRKWDSWFGDLSYPVYLFHWHSGILVAYLFGFAKSSTTLLVFGGGLTLFLAVLEVKFLSNSLENMRNKIKASVKEKVFR